MDAELDLCGQKWKPLRDGELTLFLGDCTRRRERIYASLTQQFVPPWLEDDDTDSDHRRLYLDVAFSFPHPADWRELANRVFQADEGTEDMAGNFIGAMHAPEVRLWSGGHGPIHNHAKDGWESRLTFGALTGDGYEMPYEVEAFYPSAAARAAQTKLIRDEVAEMFGEHVPEDFENLARLEEGWNFAHCGRVRMEKFHCQMPINAPDPVGLAKRHVARELKQSEFGRCYVNGGNMLDGTFKPTDGLTQSSRLVLLNVPSDYFYDWQTRQETKKRTGSKSEE